MAVEQVRAVKLSAAAIAESATTPDPGSAGVWRWSTTLNRPVMWNGTKWSAHTALTVGTTAPSAPATGDLWVDTN